MSETLASFHAVLVCHRDHPTRTLTAQWTYWDSVEEARQAEEELTPCGPHCIGVHTVVRVDVEAPPRVRRSHGLRTTNRPPSRTAGEAEAAADEATR